MARRKRRKSAGPPPAGRPRREDAPTPARRAQSPKRRPGEPIPPSFKGVLIRAVIVAVIFYPYLVYVVGESSAGAFVISLIAFVLMIPLGMLLDRMRYRMQMRRWERKRAESSSSSGR